MEHRKIWLITGASDGLGLTTVKYLVAKQQVVIAIVSDTDHLNQVMLSNPLLDVLTVDISNENQAAQVNDYVSAKYGQIDWLVNTVGETLHLVRSLLPLIRANGQGHLIDFSSRLLHNPDYSANQVMCNNKRLSELLCRDAMELGIKVTIIKPETSFVPFSIN